MVEVLKRYMVTFVKKVTKYIGETPAGFGVSFRALSERDEKLACEGPYQNGLLRWKLRRGKWSFPRKKDSTGAHRSC
jgi:hypothetical protein